MAFDEKRRTLSPPTSPLSPRPRSLHSVRSSRSGRSVRSPSPVPQDHVPEPPSRDFLAPYDVQYLSDDEINQFIDDLDHNNDGVIHYSELQAKLDAVNQEIAPNPKPHHLHHQSQDEAARHAFLRSLIGGGEGDSAATTPDRETIPRAEFFDKVKSWRIPSMKQDKDEEDNERAYMRSLPRWRRIRSWWSVHGPTVLFVALVVALNLAMGIWQCVKYATEARYQAALGWGVVLAKTSAGLLYFTLFFMILSMSRYFSTALRRSRTLSRFINWDLSQTFHIRMSILAIFLATLHAIGHLSGSFVYGSSADREPAVAALLGPDAVPRPYRRFIVSLPGITGILALGLFYLLSILSMPQVRKWNYEVFQLGHLLMYPIIGLLMAHGTKGLVQWPMLGYFLAFPTLLVLVERSVRVAVGFRRIPAVMTVLDNETIEVKATIPEARPWTYFPGQYVFLQVPDVSRWQWHPFTISGCNGRDMTLHIKTDGDWTGRVRKLAGDQKSIHIGVGIDGPFGAPAQAFYDYSHTILVGSGIGVTPFSGILADLQEKDDLEHGGPAALQNGNGHGKGDDNGARQANGNGLSRRSTTLELDREQTRVGRRSNSFREKPEKKRSGDSGGGGGGGGGGGASPFLKPIGLRVSRSMTNLSLRRSRSAVRSQKRFAEDYRRVDFHWMVRDKNHLSWFSDLLNLVSRSQHWHSLHEDLPHLDIRLQTHVTQKRKSISTHVYRWLLELHRTKEQPASPLTGLLNPTHFGRPDFVKILDRHYDEMLEFVRFLGPEAAAEKLKVGVFFCGAPIIGEILADRCRLLTARGRSEGNKIEYIFTTEVFN